MTLKQATVAAETEDLLILQAEARRRGVSLTTVLREAVKAEAGRLRAQARPRFGIARSGVGAAQAAARDPHAPVRNRRGS